MRPILLTMLTLAACWLEVSFFGALHPLGVVPNLLIIVIIYAGLICTASEAVAMALVGGFLLDLASGTDFGLRMAFYSLFCLLLIMLKREGADFDNIGLVLASTLGGSLLYDMVVLAGLVVSRIGISWPMVAGRIGRELILNLLLGLIIGPILARLLPPPRLTGFLPRHRRLS